MTHKSRKKSWINAEMKRMKPESPFVVHKGGGEGKWL